MGYFIALWLLFCAASYFVARSNNKNGYLWLVLSAILGPIVFILLALFSGVSKSSSSICTLSFHKLSLYILVNINFLICQWVILIMLFTFLNAPQWLLRWFEFIYFVLAGPANYFNKITPINHKEFNSFPPDIFLFITASMIWVIIVVFIKYTFCNRKN